MSHADLVSLGSPVVTCQTSPNIAIIKYWGKSNESDVIPLNDSLSVTLHSEQLKTTTSVYVNDVTANDDVTESQRDLVIVNGERTSVNRRTRELLRVLRSRSGLGDADVIGRGVVVVSTNNFPTASGLASSASGFAALAYALCHYFKVEGDWSVYARMGSGSACRSMWGGFVHWERGGGDSEDSRAVQLFDEHHWPQLAILVLVFSSHKKAVSSTHAMQRSVLTSSFLKQRVRSLTEEKTVQKLRAAIAERNFDSFAAICMRESNQLHAVCMDTYPPVHYLSDQSRLLIDAIHQLNESSQRTVAAYTFDAGPNAFIFYLEQDKREVFTWLQLKIPGCRLATTSLQSDENGAQGSSPVVKRRKGESESVDNDDDVMTVGHIECKVGPGPKLTHKQQLQSNSN